MRRDAGGDQWSGWRGYFEANAQRSDPEVSTPGLDPAQRTELVESLRKFQLGETGEGRLAHQIDTFRGPGVDDDFRASIKLFVREEGRHARLLGRMLNALDAPLLQRHWTATGFRAFRRCIGVRTKLLVALAAEVVGGTFYGALAEVLGSSPMAHALGQISRDEEAHLRFQTEFFASQLCSRWARALWCTLWRMCGASASLLVLWDHRRTFRAFGMSRWETWRELRARIEQVVTGVGCARPDRLRQMRAARR